MKVLFIGGTGIISSACAALALERGIELTLLTRGNSVRPVPSGAKVLQGDIRSPESVRALLADPAFAATRYDAVVDFISFVPGQVETALSVFGDKTDQYVFISSASAYRKPSVALPVVESNLLHNPYWEYSRNKIACEDYLFDRYRREGTPITIVRPSHTYDRTLWPMDGGWTVVDRMLKGKEVIVHGDGTSLWTLTHHADFAVGLVGLLGNPYSLGEAFHITGSEWLSWNDIFALVGRSMGVKPHIVHVPSDVVARFDPDWGSGLLGDKAHSMIFDNSKIKCLVPDFAPSIPFSRGVEEIAAWYRADTARQTVDGAFAARYETILAYMKR